MKRIWILVAMWLAAHGSTVPAAPPDRAPVDRSKSAHAPRTGAESARAEWEVEFDDEILLEEYAQQLDHFRIEVAAISKNGKIEAVSKLTQRKPENRVGHIETDYRLHIGWKKGMLADADRKLLARGGINPRGKELWHYFPTEVQAEMALVERAYAKRDPRGIRRTRFTIRPLTKGGYEFVVVEQDPPKPEERRESSPVSRNKPDGP